MEFVFAYIDDIMVASL
uniref:Putative LOC101074616 [Takifugu rubripes] n=1 Tax=Lepeophtheirus salmonis TaxID=72036 RepID=A0A0K2V479_LEPSM